MAMKHRNSSHLGNYYQQSLKCVKPCDYPLILHLEDLHLKCSLAVCSRLRGRTMHQYKLWVLSLVPEVRLVTLLRDHISSLTKLDRCLFPKPFSEWTQCWYNRSMMCLSLQWFQCDCIYLDAPSSDRKNRKHTRSLRLQCFLDSQTFQTPSTDIKAHLQGKRNDWVNSNKSRELWRDGAFVLCISPSSSTAPHWQRRAKGDGSERLVIVHWQQEQGMQRRGSCETREYVWIKCIATGDVRRHDSPRPQARAMFLGQ